jgi:hypothetical protein
MTREVTDAVLLFVVGLSTQIITYRLRGGRWRDIYGRYWNPPWMVATVIAILVGALTTWAGHLLIP